MTPEQVVPEITEQQLSKYPPQLHTVIRRWGLPMFEFAVTVSGTNIALDQLNEVADRFIKFQVPCTILLNNMTNFCQWLLEAKGWTFEQMQECISDIGRANELAPPPPKIVLH